MENNEFDIIIIGGGIVGTSLLYVLSNFTNIKKILLIEKYNKLGQMNSHRNNNSQTLHFGDIETNYNLEKAKKVNESASMLKKYLEKFERNNKRIYITTPKMVLGIGNYQIEKLKKRYAEFKKTFPNINLINKNEIGKIEPFIVKKRKNTENLIAIFTNEGYGVNYDSLSDSFVKNSDKKRTEIRLNEKLLKIKKENEVYSVKTTKDNYISKTLVICSGSYSLIYAKSLGYGNEFGLLPVAGSFFSTKKKFLNGKVYTMQLKGLPFAAIHGDPYVDNIDETRFGPTAKVLPLLERHNYKTFFDFLKTSVWSIKGVNSLRKVLSEPIIFKYTLKNIAYDLPIIGKILFIKEVRKIVPSIKLSEIEYKKGIGGIRPQIINIEKNKLEIGDAKIYGENIIFNITPSPGASVCLKNAEIDTKKIIEFLKNNFNSNYIFDEKRFKKELE